MAWEEQRTVPGDFKFQLTIYLYFGGVFFFSLSVYSCFAEINSSLKEKKPPCIDYIY